MLLVTTTSSSTVTASPALQYIAVCKFKFLVYKWWENEKKKKKKKNLDSTEYCNPKFCIVISISLKSVEQT